MQVAEPDWALPVPFQAQQQHQGALLALDKGPIDKHGQSVFYALADD